MTLFFGNVEKFLFVSVLITWLRCYHRRATSPSEKKDGAGNKNLILVSHSMINMYVLLQADHKLAQPRINLTESHLKSEL